MLWALQKNHLNETVLLSTQNMFRLLGKEIIAILRSKSLLNWTYENINPISPTSKSTLGITQIITIFSLSIM